MRALGAALLSLVALGCGDSTGTDDFIPATGIAVLNGFGRTGITLVDPSATGNPNGDALVHLPDDFDGGSILVLRDTAITTSSKGAGDKLFIAALSPVGSAVAVQLPSGSNPAGAIFSRGATGNGFLVALRDSGAIARVIVPATGAPVVTLLRGAGRCPSDVFTNRDRVWSVDANLGCDAGGYEPQGAPRLIRLPATPGGAADTIVLTGTENATGAVAIDDIAYVATAGYTDYSSFPYQVRSSGVLLRVDLATRTITGRYALPAASTGGSLRVGADGTLFVRYYEDVESFTERVIALDRSTLAPRGPRAAGQPYLALRKSDGSVAACGPTISDSEGAFVCIETPAGSSASTLIVFDSAGDERRRFAAGQGAVDLSFR